MRSRVALIFGLAAALSGCLSSFPEQSRVVAVFEVGDLGAGEMASSNFTVGAGTGFLVVGYRAGPSSGETVVLEAPNGTRYDMAAGESPAPCAVVDPSPGLWSLRVGTDSLKGFLKGGKFTVRAAPGPPPAAYPCKNDIFPGHARPVTLAVWNVSLSAGQVFRETFEQPFFLDRMEAAVSDAPENVTTNVTLRLDSPQGASFSGANATNPVQGIWAIEVSPLAAFPPNSGNVTVAVRGSGT